LRKILKPTSPLPIPSPPSVIAESDIKGDTDGMTEKSMNRYVIASHKAIGGAWVDLENPVNSLNKKTAPHF
jgi:hypothetical protein